MAKIELNPTVIFLAGTAWAALWAAVGWWLNHKLSTVRDRRKRTYDLEDAMDERRRHFDGFMSGFRSWAERSAPDKVSDNFSDRVNEFSVEAAKSRSDTPESKIAQFDNAVLALRQLTAAQVSDYQRTNAADNKTWYTDYVGRKRLVAAIDAVTKTLE